MYVARSLTARSSVHLLLQPGGCCDPLRIARSLTSRSVLLLQPSKPLDANRYATKKTIAQGMLDIALLTANASQLKYILQVGPRHEFYSLMLGLIATSMILQVSVSDLETVTPSVKVRDQSIESSPGGRQRFSKSSAGYNYTRSRASDARRSFQW